MNGKLHIAGNSLIWYIYLHVAHVLTRRVHGRIYRLDLKKGNGQLGKLDIDTLDSSMMKKMATDLKTNGKKPGYTSRLRG